MEAERDLAIDAQWKKIQQNTFTRWANEHLKIIDQTILNLETDLSDGLRLIALIEVLSQKRMPKHNKRPTFRSQKLENVAVALKFLEDEHIKIINIGESLWFCFIIVAVVRGDRALQFDHITVQIGVDDNSLCPLMTRLILTTMTTLTRC